MTFSSYYCDNATTSEDDMLNNKKCPAGKYCAGGLSDVSQATDCSLGKYCPEGQLKVMDELYQDNLQKGWWKKKLKEKDDKNNNLHSVVIF